MKKVIFIFIVCISFLVACGNGIDKEEFPYNLIHAGFSYASFKIPEEWDVVSIQSNVKMRHQDWENPEKHVYADVPYRYTFIFGKKGTENTVSEEKIEEFNEKQALKGETSRQIYYHTYYAHYGTLQISDNGFLRLLSEYEDTQEWEINGETMLVLRQGNDWILNWYKDKKYYDLLITSEAGVSTEIQFEEMIHYLFFD